MKKNNAFTKIELAVVLAVIGIMFGLLMSALHTVKEKNHGVICKNNLKTLTWAWELYTRNHNGRLPPNSDGPNAGRNINTPSWVAGRLKTEREAGDHSDNTNTALLVSQHLSEYGSIGTNITSPLIYRCPSDKSGRVRSYAMNAFMGGTGRWRSDEYKTYRLAKEIEYPAMQFVFIDEREDSIDDGYFAIAATNRYAIISYPAARHMYKANLSFADGHVESFRFREKTTSPPRKKGYPLPKVPMFTSSTDKDMRWLIKAATEPVKKIK